MFEGQITALLGHNGAGKTTTISMLTGLYPPTSGSARVNGFDVVTNMDGVRQSLGICPQHDVLFDNLTVKEHLVFFCKLKGFPGEKVPFETERMLTVLGLESKRNALSKTLSGGMKRKLSVGLALVGGSKVVMLDEPTAGMDPAARRFTWNLLQQESEGRTILLTTHFMDEADLLGDRIAIMASGQLQCCGSSLFLKKKYGAGYHMVIVKEAECDVNNITEVITAHVPDAVMETNIGAELAYILPSESSKNFVQLFTQLEDNQSEFGIAGYGMSVTTMEEVFIRVGESTDTSLRGKLVKDDDVFYDSTQDSVTIIDKEANQASLIPTTNFVHEYERNTGFVLYMQQFRAMFAKRMTFTVRSLKTIIPQLIVPLAFVTIALTVVKTVPTPQDLPLLNLTTKAFFRNIIPYAVPTTTNPPLLYNLTHIYIGQFNNVPVIPVNLNTLPKYAGDPRVQRFVLDTASQNIGTFNSECVIGAFFEITNNETIEATIYWNNQPYHGAGVSMQALDNALIKFFVSPEYEIIVANHPLPMTSENKLGNEVSNQFTSFMISYLLNFGMTFLIASFALFLIQERTVKAKHIQFVSGVHVFNFWLSTFLWDYVNYCIPCAFILVAFRLFGIGAYIEHQGTLIVLFLLYGWAILPMTYILSFLFEIPSTGFVRLIIIYIITGMVTYMAVSIMLIPSLGLEWLSLILEWILLVPLPNYGMAQALFDFYNNHELNEICLDPVIQTICQRNITNACCQNNCGDNCVEYNTQYAGWEKPGIGRMIVFMFFQGIVYFAIMFLLESNFGRSVYYKMRAMFGKKSCEGTTAEGNFSVKEDEDVTCERNRIATTPIRKLTRDNVLVLDELSKYYGSLLAVDRLSFGVPQAECFGLLGINGAGKTTTFKMMTGDETLSSGAAYLDGFSIHDDIKKVQQRLGYCPQFDALIDHLTGRETLHMFARLRGVPEKSIPQLVTDLMDTLLLSQHADQAAGTYSGGNKRKLSTAISLVGDPPVVFLDEPSTGMDPVARRLLWDTLAKVRAAGRCIILTSHSMEECEALCTRLAIMVNGQFKCLGSPQHLKTKFGQGYTLMLKVSFNTNTSDIILHIQKKFKGAILKDKHQGFLHFHIPAGENVTWAKMFAIMEESKVEYNVEDYSISQTTLEQVFLNFAKSQRATTEDERP